MSDERAQGDAYYEVQVDRETLVLLALGLLAVLVAAFLVGRWTAPRGAAPAAEELAATLAPEDEAAELGDPAEAEDVDGEPLFGGSPVSAEGAPPIAPVPSEPLPERAAAARTPAAPAEAAPAAVAPESRSPKPAPAEGWVVQVSAVKSSRDAERLRAELAKKGWPVRVVRESGFSKVQVGPFAAQADAQAAERRLKREESLSTWVKRS